MSTTGRFIVWTQFNDTPALTSSLDRSRVPFAAAVLAAAAVFIIASPPFPTRPWLGYYHHCIISFSEPLHFFCLLLYFTIVFSVLFVFCMHHGSMV